MDPDETQMFVEAYWWRWEMEDRKAAHYAAMDLMAAGVKKEKAKPKKIKFLAEWHDDNAGEAPPEEPPQLEAESRTAPRKPAARKRSAEDDKAAFKRLKQHRREENAAANARANGG